MLLNNSKYQQAVYLIICSVIVGMLFNYFQSNRIPIIAKQINGFSDSLQIDEFVVEIIDLKIAKKFFYDDVLFIDARDNISFNASHISGAIPSVPYNSMVDHIFDNSGLNKPIVIYCDDEECGLSEDLANQLQAEGFSKIYVFQGGWNQWLLAKLPVE